VSPEHRGGSLGAAVARGAVLTMIYAFLLAPILIVVVTSLNASALNTFPPQGLSLRWYREFLRSDGFTSAFRFSLWLGVQAALGATLIGFMSAYGIVRFARRHRNLGQSLALLPVMVPHVLIGMSLLLMFTVVPFPDYGRLLVGHVVIALPFTVAAILASLDGTDPMLELAAMSLGASRVRALWEIVVPLIAPGLLSALLFGFIVSFGDVYISLFLSGPGMTTLPIEIFTYMLWESTPVVAAITTVQIGLIIVLGFIVERLIGLRRVFRI
jgi:putative spermidine/putrescine transport system permease protein